MFYIYHFTNTKSLLGILDSASLKFGNIENTNDPKEYLGPDFSISYWNGFGFIEDSMKFKHKVRNAIREYKMLCFCREGIARGYMRPKMWAQYGEMHEGCCLIFDKGLFEKKAFSSIKCEKYKGRIYYDAENKGKIELEIGRNNDEDEIAIERFIKENMRYLLFTKSYDWKNEEEYRYIIKSCDEEKLYVDIEPAIVGVVFGHKFSNTLREKVIEYFESDKEYIEINWSNGLCSVNRRWKNYKDYLLRKINDTYSYNLLKLGNDYNVLGENVNKAFESMLERKIIDKDQYSSLMNINKSIKKPYNEFTVDSLNNLMKEIISIFSRLELRALPSGRAARR